MDFVSKENKERLAAEMNSFAEENRQRIRDLANIARRAIRRALTSIDDTIKAAE